MIKKFVTILFAVAFITACSNDADVVSTNLSIAADNFQIQRRIIFTNTWTDSYLLSITGLCSIKSAEQTTEESGIAVTCMVGPGEYKKHYLGLSGNVSYFSEQLDASPTDRYHYEIVFKPSAIIPIVKIR